MRFWRISDFADLSGEGGLVAPGRWHSKGRRIVYMSDHPAASLIELLVRFQIDPADIPDDYQLLTIDVAAEVVFDAVELSDLPPEWRQTRKVTQEIGDRWLSEMNCALLRVPSAIVPYAFNWLLNPSHTDAGTARVAEKIRTPLDPRFLRRG
jgi:RES domain-containing protein